MFINLLYDLDYLRIFCRCCSNDSVFERDLKRASSFKHEVHMHFGNLLTVVVVAEQAMVVAVGQFVSAQ